MAVLAFVIGIQLVGNILFHGYSTALVASRVATLTDLGWGTSNYVAAVASLAAACAIALLLFGTRNERAIGALGVLGALIVQVTTLSRGGAVALILGLALAGLVEARRTARRRASGHLGSGRRLHVIAARRGEPRAVHEHSRAGFDRRTFPLLPRSMVHLAVALDRRGGTRPDPLPHPASTSEPIHTTSSSSNSRTLGLVGLALYVALFAES